LQATTDLYGNCTLRHSGTSAAAPEAAGVFALALEAKYAVRAFLVSSGKEWAWGLFNVHHMSTFCWNKQNEQLMRCWIQ